jgi:hypothetical protein
VSISGPPVLTHRCRYGRSKASGHGRLDFDLLSLGR